MLKSIKHFFVPTPKNGHHPHGLKRGFTLTALLLVFIFELILASSILIGTRTEFLGQIFSSVISQETNVNREQAGISSLKYNPVLETAAQAKANDMASKGYFSHISPDGTQPWYWMDIQGYSFSYAGENLAINFVDSKDVVRAWMNSSSHKENILNSKFTEIGVGIAQGNFEGREATFVVQFFGTPIIPNPTEPVLAYENVTESFIEIPNAENAEVVESESAGVVEASFVEKTVASPKTSSNFIYFLILFVIISVLAISTMFGVHKKHGKMVLADAAVLAVVLVGVLIVHSWLGSQINVI